MPSRALVLLLFILLVLGGGTLIGLLNVPEGWYEALNKPAFNPPDWLFGPVWTVLYCLIAVAGYRTWIRRKTGTAMAVWWAQLILNFVWSPVFFRLEMIGLALAIIILLLVAIVSFIVATRRVDRISSLLFVPYAAWVAFATVLNGAIFALN